MFKFGQPRGIDECPGLLVACKQHAAFLIGFADRRDAHREFPVVEIFRAVDETAYIFEPVPRIDLATWKDERSRCKVDLVMAHHP